MNTLTDLRRTLDRHAGDLDDPTAHARTAAVHHRIAVVRRRRRAAGTGVLALAVVAGLATVQLRSGPDAAPAGPVVLGQRAPATIRALGYTYRTTGHGVSFGRRGAIRISASTRPQLVSWTTDRGVDVRVTLPDHSVLHSSESGFRDFTVIAPGEKGSLRVGVARGRVGLASYALTSAPPPGYTADGLTYRSRVAGSSLLAARIGAPGQTVATTTYVAPHGWVSVREMCTRLPRGAVVNVSLNGNGRVTGDSCDSDGTFDPATGGEASFPVHSPGRTVRVRVWVSRGYHDPTPLPAGSVPGLRLGVGVYGPLHQQRVGGDLVSRVLEQGGHAYRLVSWQNSTGAPLDLPAAGVDRLATLAWHTHGWTEVTFGTGSSSAPEGGSYSGGRAAIPGVFVAAGSPVHASLDRGTGTFGVAFYERID